MAILDISAPFAEKPCSPAHDIAIRRRDIPLKSASTAYTGVVYRLELGSMSTSYIDLPGHIAETDDGVHGANVDVTQFFRIPCRVIQFRYDSGYGPIDAAQLEQALGGRPDTPGLILNALGNRHQLQPDFDERSVYLTMDAVKWIIDSGVKVLLSDVYESKSLDGVFLEFFKHGVATICEGRGMGRIHGTRAYLTVMFLPWPGVTQLPCRLLVETE